MTVLALGVALYAIAVLALPAFGPAFIHERRAAAPLAVWAHLAGGSLALALGPWQFLSSIRARAVAVHRWMGRSYVVAVLVGGLGALALAPQSQHGLVTHVGFGLLAVPWLLATLLAWWHIRRHEIAAHKRWMTRSYALTLASLFVQALNEMINVNDRRRAVHDNHVPETVINLLFSVALGSLGYIAYGYGLSGKRRHASTAIFALLIAMVLTIILDLDRPRRGLIRVDDAGMVRLQQSMRVTRAPT